jgi:hypothetical protein
VRGAAAMHWSNRTPEAASASIVPVRTRRAP